LGRRRVTAIERTTATPGVFAPKKSSVFQTRAVSGLKHLMATIGLSRRAARRRENKKSSSSTLFSFFDAGCEEAVTNEMIGEYLQGKIADGNF
jgi:hypothetical protein